MHKLQRNLSIMIATAIALPGLVNGQSLPSSAVVGLVVLALAVALLYRSFGTTAVFALTTRSMPLMIALGLCFMLPFLIGLGSGDALVQRASRALLLVSGTSLALFVVVFLYLANRIPADRAVQVVGTGLYQALLVICCLQIVLLVLGLNHVLAPYLPQTSTLNSTLQSFGIHANRVMMPIGTGMQYPATLAAVLVSMALVRLKMMRDRWAVLGVIVGTVVVVLIDSRTAIAGPIIAIACLIMCRRSVGLCFVVAVTLPMVMLGYLALQGILAGLFQDLALGRYAAFGLFSGRETIWFHATKQVFENSLGQTLFGSGIFSQIDLGLSLEYSHLFSNTTAEGQQLASLHNSYLQLWMDGGLIGFGVYLLAIFVALRRVHRASHAAPVVFYQFTAALFTLTWIGASEVIMLPYAREGFVLVLFLIILPAVMPWLRSSTPEPAAPDRGPAHPIGSSPQNQF